MCMQDCLVTNAGIDKLFLSSLPANGGQLKIQWAIKDDYIYLRIASPSKGWTAVMLNPG